MIGTHIEFLQDKFGQCFARTLAAGIACTIIAACQAPVAADKLQRNSSFLAVDISVENLHGAYVDAGEKAPVILIVPGSGPIDRDGNMPGMQSNVYKHLAEGLAGKGISTVRVDKRGMYSSALAGDPNAVTLDMYASDYGSWIDRVKAKTGISCVYLLGHSEGGLMVTQTAIGRSDVCGLILAAAPGRPT